MQSYRIVRSTAAAAALAAAVAGGYLYRGRASAAPAAPLPAEVVQPAAAPAAPAPSPAGLPAFAAIVKRYGPAVVNVSTTGVVKTGDESPSGDLDPQDPFRFFFGPFHGRRGNGQSLVRGIGSGFIVSPDGTILTNAHVVKGARQVKVKLADRREFRAKVVGMDETADVAVLRIRAKDLPTVQLGDPSRTQVGEWVLAIGSPFGFEQSATAGILSARSRSLPDEGYVPFLQTDVAVNPGNSGGPLFDTAGEVIGINSQIYTQSGGYMGLSFAIPIDVAMKVEHQLVAHGKVVRGQLGVTIQDVDQSLAEAFGLPRPGGALVSSVQKGSAAGEAGVKPGDVILALDGRDVSGASDLAPRVADLAPGTEAKLTIWRDHARRELRVRVGEAKDVASAASATGREKPGRLGLAVRPLTPEEKGQAGIEGGLVVEAAEGPAAQAGIQAGDVVLALDGTRVDSVSQLRALVAKAAEHVALLVARGGARIFVPIDLG
jgi:serine protease Do